MNIALNLLPTKSTTAQVSSAKNSSTTSKKTSFSDTLNKAVHKADEANYNEQERSYVEDSTNLLAKNDSGKKESAAKQVQDLPDSPESAADVTTPSDDGAIPTTEGLTSLTNAIAAAQNPLVAPVVSVQNEQLALAAQQAVNTITAVSNVSELSSGVLAATGAGADGNSQSNQNQDTNLVQVGQTAPEMLDKLSGNITAVVSGTNTQQATQAGLNSQNQIANAETLQSNTTFMEQLAVSMQEQTGNTATVQSAGNVVQQATAGQNQMMKPESTTQSTIQEQQAVMPKSLPIEANSQQDALNSNLNGEGQEEGSADAGTLKVVQDIPSKGLELTNSAMFAQNLKATLTNEINSARTAEAKPTTDTYQIVDQIVEQTKIITKPQNTEMIMKLKPEHLGELTLKVVVENGTVNASFHSNNPEVRSLIEASLPQLKQELASTGLKVDNVSVYAGLGQFQPNQEQDRSSQQQLAKFTSKKSTDDFIEAVEGELAGAVLSGNGSQSGVDYRI